MNRETRTIKTPVGNHEVVINSFLTGGDKRKLMQEPDQFKIQEITIQLLVISVDGQKENVGKMIDEMHGKDFDYIFLEIAKAMNDSSWQEKKS